ESMSSKRLQPCVNWPLRRVPQACPAHLSATQLCPVVSTTSRSSRHWLTTSWASSMELRWCCCKQEFQITNYLLVCSATLVPDPPFSSKTRVCNSTIVQV